MDRRSSKEGKDGKPPQSPRNSDVFDDEYALDPDEDDFMPSVSDGFRPANANQSLPDRPMHDEHEPFRTQTVLPKSVEGTDLRRMATRNSTAKAPLALDSVSQNSNHRRGLGSQATHLQHRESISSTASFATMANSDGPFGTGPSHPYGMYPQTTMARSASIATTSTQRQQQQRPLSMQHPTGPAHPYGMYPQNVIEDEPPVPPVQTAIPVGFPGISTGFHRQIGPDGEEQDIVGPFGHTEQLPPYSRYPEEGPTKASLAAEASATPIEPRTDPLAGSDDALLVDAARAAPSAPPSPVSPIASLAPVTPARLPQQRPETQSGNVAPRPATTSESASLLTTEDSVTAEKVEPAASVKNVSWHKKRLFGRIPVTVVFVLLILLLIFAIVLGVAVGTLLTKHKDKDKTMDKDDGKNEKPELQITGNTLFGATPIATPTSLPPLPTGQFSLPLGYAQEQNPNCLMHANQYAAWSCKMSFAPIQVIVNFTEEGYLASLSSWVAPDGGIQYGLQAPIIPPSNLQLVDDLDLRGYGPAWHFSSRYDKVVVLQKEDFIAGSSLRKRGDGGDASSPSFRHHFQVQPGDNPWYCIWNSTYIEGYIYVMDNSTAATMTTNPTANPSDAFSYTATATSSESSAEPASASATPPPSRRSSGTQASDFRFPYPYPRIVKIEERRLPGATQPYCQKMQLLDNGQIAPASSSNGGNVIIYLTEQDPPIQEFFGAPPGPQSSQASGLSEKRRVEKKRSDPSSACHCEWMFQ